MKQQRSGLSQWFWMVFVLCGVVSQPLLGVPMALEDEALPAQENLALWTEAGYESGPVPDWFLAHRASFGLPAGFQLRLEGAWGGFPQQSLVRFDSVEGSLRWQGLSGEGWGVQAEAGGFLFPGDPVAVPYSGKTPLISHVVSPRAWGGQGMQTGVLGWLDLPAGWGLQSSVRAAYVWDTTAPWYGWSDGLRVEASVVPSYRIWGPISLLVENRGVYWKDRGYSYEVLPEVSFGPWNDWAATAGVGIPVVGVSIWRGLVGVRWVAPVKVAAVVQAVSGSLETVNWDFQVIPEGNNLRIRIYFTFLGDRADLFEPQNATYGAQNRKLMQKLLDYISQYPAARFQIEGHTNRANLSKSYEDEQKTEMLPLARSRGESVSRALGALGIDKKRMILVPVGGAKPLAKFDDADNSWKNRRVEIVILRE